MRRAPGSSAERAAAGAPAPPGAGGGRGGGAAERGAPRRGARADPRLEPARGVAGAEDLRGGGPVVVEGEGQRVTPAEQAVAAAGQPDAVGLEAVPEPGLGDAPAGLEVVEEAAQLAGEVGVELADVGGH